MGAAVVLVVFLCCCAVGGTAAADDEVINIDCGSSDSYVDGITNITWVPDAQYITTGVNAEVPDANTSYPQFSEFTTLRYFPDSRKKNCYSLPVTPNNTYLIRATFFYGSYDQNINATTTTLGLPSFQIAIDETLVSNVTFENADTFTYREFSVASQSFVIYLCLVRDDSSSQSSNPFVSSISLHPLPSYPPFVVADLVQDQRQYYQTKYRLSFGGQATDLIRAPSDAFDRYWNPGGSAYVQATTGALQNLTTFGNETVAVAQNVSGLPPAAVMDTAVSTSTGDANLTISLPLDVVTGGDNESSNSSTSSTTIYLGLYFAELNSTATRFSRQFYVQVPAAAAALSSSSSSSSSSVSSSSNSSSADPDVLFENPYNISGGALIASQESWQLQYSSSSSSNNSTSDQLLLQENLFDIVLFPALNYDDSQPLGPSLNALELLERIDSTATRTNDRDALAIEDIKSCLNLTEWTGDPCLPYPHSWLTCDSVNMTTSPSIIAVDLSGYNLNGTVCPSFGNLSSLTSLSLASNELMGPLPSELEDLTNLRTLQVQNNHLTGTLPDWLTSLPLLTLEVQNNDFTGAIPTPLLLNNNLNFSYEPGNPSLTNSTATSPPPTTNTNTSTTSTNTVVGAVVGANFAQIAVIVLGILYHQGKVSFNFCGIFRKMGSSWWRKAEDELLENMKDSGDVEEWTNHQEHAMVQHVVTAGVASNGGIYEPERLATAKSGFATEEAQGQAQELLHHIVPPNNNNNNDPPPQQLFAAGAAAAGAAGLATIASAQGFVGAAADASNGFVGSATAVSKPGVAAGAKGLVATEGASLVAAGKAGFASALARAEKAPLEYLIGASHGTTVGDIEESIKEQAQTSTKNLLMSGEQFVMQELRSSATSVQAAAVAHVASAAAHVIAEGSEEWQHVLSSLEDERKRAWGTLSKLKIIKDETEQELMLFSKQMQDRQNLFQTANSKLEQLRNQHSLETQQLNTLLMTVSSRTKEAAAKVASEAAAEAVAAGQEAAAKAVADGQEAAVKAVGDGQAAAAAAAVKAVADGQEAVVAAAVKAVADGQEAAAATVQAVADGQEAAAAAVKAVAGDQETAVAAGQEAAAALKAVATDQEAAAAAAAAVQSQILDCRTHLEALQRRIDSQIGIVDAFQELLDTAESERQNLNDKWQAHNSTWLAATEWYQACNRHKAALSSQLRSMQSGLQRPSLSPSPVLAGGFNTSFMSIANAAAAGVIDATAAAAAAVGVVAATTLSSSSSSAAAAAAAATASSSSSSTVEALSVSPCPFCNRGFKPAWAALVVSCEHAYHIWCALTHFSSSTKCLHKDCQQEMHADFWRNSGIKMPTANANSNPTVDAAIGALDAADDLQENFLHQHDEEAQHHHHIMEGFDTSRMAENLEGMVQTSISEIAKDEQLAAEIRTTGSRIIKIINPLRQIVVFVVRIFRN